MWCNFFLLRYDKKDTKKSSSEERKKSSEKLVSHLLDSYLKKDSRPAKTYPPREPVQEMMACYDFLSTGKTFK